VIELTSRLLRSRPWLVVNEHEAAALTGEDDPTSAARALARMTKSPAIVTRGGDGALAVADTELFVVAAPPVEVVDTTGAGDAFCGTLASLIARGVPLGQALADATAAGSRAVTVMGARGWLRATP
jgi:ribokinase